MPERRYSRSAAKDCTLIELMRVSGTGSICRTVSGWVGVCCCIPLAGWPTYAIRPAQRMPSVRRRRVHLNIELRRDTET